MPRDYGFTRTNYFRITDLDEIDFLMNGVIAEDLEVLLARFQHLYPLRRRNPGNGRRIV